MLKNIDAAALRASNSVIGAPARSPSASSRSVPSMKNYLRDQRVRHHVADGVPSDEQFESDRADTPTWPKRSVPPKAVTMSQRRRR